MSFFSNFLNIFSKSSATTELIVKLLGGSLPWNKTDFKTLAKEGFGNNATVFACIDAVAKAVSGVPWKLSRMQNNGELVEIKNHKLLTLLNRPNPLQGKAEFIEEAIGYLLISGNSYIEQVGPDNSPPRELYNLRPDRIEIIPDIRNMVGGYKYTAAGQSVDLKFAELLHLRLFAPLDDWYGLSPMTVAARDIDSDNAAKRWNFNLLSNSARPSGALSSPGNLNEKAYSRLKNQIKKQWSGMQNAGKPIVLEAGLNWQQMSMSPSDMDWLSGRKFSALQVCQVYGVPPEVIGIQDSKTYASYAEARKAFYLETILPVLDKLRDDFNNWLVPLFGADLVLNYNRDAIEALQESREKVWSRVDKASWLTINEKRVLTGFDEINDGNVILIPANQLPLGVVVSSGGDDEDDE